MDTVIRKIDRYYSVKDLNFTYDLSKHRWRPELRKEQGISRSGRFITYRLRNVPAKYTRQDIYEKLCLIVPPTDIDYLDFNNRHSWMRMPVKMPMMITESEAVVQHQKEVPGQSE